MKITRTQWILHFFIAVLLTSPCSVQAADVRCRVKNKFTPELNRQLLSTGAPSWSSLEGRNADDEIALSQWSPDRHTYRVCLYDQSLELGVFNGSPSSGGQLLVTIRPGSCADVSGEQLYAKYHCELSANECASRDSLYRECKKNGRVIERYPYWIRGWSAAEAHFKRPPRRSEMVGPDGYAKIAPTSSIAQIALLDQPRYYTICGSSYYVLYDGKRLDPGRKQCVEVNARNVRLESHESQKPSVLKFYFTREAK
jgi:hypothetical protein